MNGETLYLLNKLSQSKGFWVYMLQNCCLYHSSDVYITILNTLSDHSLRIMKTFLVHSVRGYSDSLSLKNVNFDQMLTNTKKYMLFLRPSKLHYKSCCLSIVHILQKVKPKIYYICISNSIALVINMFTMLTFILVQIIYQFGFTLYKRIRCKTIISNKTNTQQLEQVNYTAIYYLLM